METCKTCRWWGTLSGGKSENRECLHPKLCEPSDVTEDAMDLLTTYYSHAGGIFTGPDFGCIHHEAKG
jgi:hypothetical protein